MKEINIKIRINEEDNQIATATHTLSYDKKSISDQFEILGILENLCDLQKEKIKTLLRVSKDKE